MTANGDKEMDKVILKHLVEKNREGSYYKLPFQVPEGTRSVTVSYSYPGTGGNVIDLGLEDGEGQFLGWSGSSRFSITVSEYNATPGYFMKPVKPGLWNILIGAYHVQREGVPVCYEITFEKEEYSWLFGDLHVHSDASDGQHDIPTLAKKAKAMGLDFLAVTNHNNYSENFSLPRIPGLTLIPGVEWTHYRGHMNFFGIRQPFLGSFIANNIEQMEQIVKEARENGAVISANHPKCPMCPYLWENETAFQLIEIWNGPMRKANMDGIAWWTKFLTWGRKISAVGGSDFHRDHQPAKMGRPVTAVYAKSPSVEDIMDAIVQGRSYIINDIHGVRLAMTCADRGFGEVMEKEKKSSLHVEAEKMPVHSLLRLIDRRGVLSELVPVHGNICCEVDSEPEGFVYMLAVQKLPGNRERVVAVSNPIYFKE